MQEITIEVVASSVRSCIEAEKGGANRIELCSALATAGVTPSAGLLEAVKNNTGLPVFVMLRPREGDFCYDSHELEVIKLDIEILKSSVAVGFVAGVLMPNGKVDVVTMTMIVNLCKPLPVTFHRAIDCTPDMKEALEAIIETGCIRILTSGGKPTGPDGIEKILELVEQAGKRISIMPGGGIRPETFPRVFHNSINEYHLSGRIPVQSSMPSTLFEMDWAETSSEEIRKVVEYASGRN